MYKVAVTRKQKEILVWLAGLISSDGSIALAGKNKKSVIITLCSKNVDWLIIIKKKIKTLGFSSKIYYYPKCSLLHLREPRRLYELLKAINGNQWMIDYKYNNLERAYKNTKNVNRRWLKEELDYIRKNYIVKSHKGKRGNCSNALELAKEFDTTRRSIIYIARRLKKEAGGDYKFYYPR